MSAKKKSLISSKPAAKTEKAEKNIGESKGLNVKTLVKRTFKGRNYKF